jgi:hypothetical protein
VELFGSPGKKQVQNENRLGKQCRAF